MEDPRPPSDRDPRETAEWRESLQAVIDHDGPDRAAFLLATLRQEAVRAGVPLEPAKPAYVNSVAVASQPVYPGDLAIEARIEAIVRWNAMAMVVRANRRAPELGGHLSTYASAATLYEVGFNHFFRARTDDRLADLVYYQAHCAPGLYARARLGGRLDDEHLDRFRQETRGRGLSSYPHPWLMRDFWQFATVSMGLGSLMSIYQARFIRYMENRELLPRSDRHVWAFLGDGEMDEPESLGAITVAAREGLDNLIFVVNCNLQRLDGPVRGNASIVRELEGLFRGAGWNVIKLLWGSEWDPLLAGTTGDRLVRRLGDMVDGEAQRYAADTQGDVIRQGLFGVDPGLAALVSDLSDAELAAMRRGGHDPVKIHAAYAAAVAHRDSPTIILAQTVKGYRLGADAQGRNIAHQHKKLSDEAVRAYRDELGIPISDAELDDVPYYTPHTDSEEIRYLCERRRRLGGSLPARRADAPTLPPPPADAFARILEGTGDRENSTTMAFVRILSGLLRDRHLGPHVVPIVADEARTFGMEGLFRQIGIYAPRGQQYEPVDRDQLAFYREDTSGQILQEGISEAGAISSWMAAGTAYSTHGRPMVPFYIYYSMFGFQRVGDLAWAAADMQARGFLLGATSGRTTLAGEGLQHQDGHSHLLASTIPNCRAYDPTYAYEVATILRAGLESMFERQECVYYYLTLLNEAYAHPPMPAGVEQGILDGMYRLHDAPDGQVAVRLLGSGAILREVEAAARLLADDHGVSAEVWSVPSFNELGRDGREKERWNRLHPGEDTRPARVEENFGAGGIPVVAATDYVSALAEQIRPWVRAPYTVLGTDGFGRSDTRARLRDFFEVDSRHVAAAALATLARTGHVEAARAAAAINDYDIDPETIPPVRR